LQQVGGFLRHLQQVDGFLRVLRFINQ
jgi:hypothetical protein